VRGALKGNTVVAVVFNFVDLLTHGRSENAILMEVARRCTRYRALTRQCSSALLRCACCAKPLPKKIPVVLTTDHGRFIVCARHDLRAS